MEKDVRRKHVHTALVPIRWGDMDTMGHVNNTVYFRYMEQARLEWLEALGLPAHQRVAEGPVIVNASCTFQVPFIYPGTVEVSIYAGHAGRSSLPTYYEMRLMGDERIYAEGAAKMVWTSTETGKSIPLPTRLRAQVEDI
jgi:acyl-CoA thioester hydrolase